MQEHHLELNEHLYMTRAAHSGKGVPTEELLSLSSAVVSFSVGPPYLVSLHFAQLLTPSHSLGSLEVLTVILRVRFYNGLM